MPIEARISKYKKNSFKIGIALCIAAAIYCAYDGYWNKSFIDKHTDNLGRPDSTLVFNQKSPPYFIGAALLLGVYLFTIKNKKVVADENQLVINDKVKIHYDSIEKINKTYFDSKGYFTITYKNKNSNEVNSKLSDRTYDNLPAILEKLVEKIS